MIRNTPEGWGWPARALHWVVAVMVLGLFVHGLWMEELENARTFNIWLHSAVGISLLAIAAVGFVWWLTNAAPAEPTGTPKWQQWAARLTYWGLYALIFAVALAGWALTGTMHPPVAVDLFGLIEVPQLVAPDSAGHEQYEELHEALANVLIGLVAVHVAAALYHHFVRRDKVLLRMLGSKPRRSE